MIPNLYEKTAGIYDIVLHKEVLDDDLDFYRSLINPGQSVADIGCGTGRVSLELAKIGCQVTGVDLSESMLNEFQKKIPEQYADRIHLLCRDMKALDLREPLREASFLVEMGRNDIAFERVFGDEPLTGTYDTRLLGQAFGNVIKNAAEAIDGAVRDGSEPGVIRIHAYHKGGLNVVDIIDNGKGLPRENRQRLLEPYMTTRDKGTGLGLAIVKKIVEDHGGQLELHDAPTSFHGGRGAMIRMTFPYSAQQQAGRKSQVPDRTEEQEKVKDGV